MKKYYILILVLASIGTHFLFFGHPDSVVFDEVHFGKFVNGYLTGEYFFDIHPPLGKLIITGAARVSGFDGKFAFEDIGNTYATGHYKYLRLLPAVAGTLLPLIIFFLALQLGVSEKFSLAAGLMAAFDNALITQSRFILMDSFLLLFGFAALLFFLRKNLLGAGIFAALAVSIKWTGATFLGIIGLLFFFQWLRHTDKFKSLIRGTLYLLAIPCAVYFAIFAVHFSLLTEPGPGDAFMQPNFQQNNIVEKFNELNGLMYTTNRDLNADHPYSSQWYQWPFNKKPVYYWVQEGRRIYLLGNPFVWLAALLGILVLSIYMSANALKKPLITRATNSKLQITNYKQITNFKFQNSVIWFLLLGFFANWLPFIFIGRVMFLYHYFTALLFGILAAVFVADKFLPESKNDVFKTLLAGVLIGFLIIAPFTYGLALPAWLTPLSEFFI